CVDARPGPPMNDAFDFHDLLPALPEIVLAIGAMVLLMLGAFRGERSTTAVNWVAIVLLVAAGAIVVWLPGDKLIAFGGSFVLDTFARFLTLLSLPPSSAPI